MTSVSVPTSRQKSSARLHAVQAVYDMLMTGHDSRDAVNSFFDRAGPVEPDMAELAAPAPDLFVLIVGGVEKTRTTLDEVISKHLKDGATAPQMAEREPLLLAILLCGVYELMAHTDIDAPVIISDYINVAHSYYQGQESRVINGILDAVRPLYRQG